MKFCVVVFLLLQVLQWNVSVVSSEAVEVESKNDESEDKVTKRTGVPQTRQQAYQNPQQIITSAEQQRATFKQPSPGYAAAQTANAFNTRTNDPTYPEIMNASLEILIKQRVSPQQVKDVLMKYYFTDKKEMSVWPKAIEETGKQLNLDFTERELFDMENDVKSIYRRMIECDLLLDEKKKKKKSKEKLYRLYAKCYMTLRDFIDDGFTDFGFPRGTVEGQAKVLEMGLAYNMMSLLVLRMSQAVAENADVSSFKVAKAIINIAENVVTSVKNVTKETIDARIQAISQIEICMVQEVLWQELTVSCEFRTKRDVETGAGIGGPADKFKQKYRAKVIDAVTKKEVCNIAMSTSDTQDKTAVKEELTKKCATQRDKYARSVKYQVKKFYADRVIPVVTRLPELWSNDKKKLQEIKAKLNSKTNYD